ncbi:AEC family transporter [Microcoleus sp. LEGE 07076]|uniref:AEC family transporter n=1 Tax=Microcoleus sp. LEGE 07076 TaxID=915322 RepID=UPI00188134D3|nr:AEC family transporter [Microcoleus sp. LEGE 07076]MBE9183833.1 AEC family transporter [Microcoleus sp. LEGE 07076]
MLNLDNPLLKLYLNLIGWVAIGFIFGSLLPRSCATYLAKFLFFFGTPLSIVAFIRRANLSGTILIAPLTAWTAIVAGGGLAWLLIYLVSAGRFKTLNRLAKNTSEHTTAWSLPNRGSFLLAAMFGNTGFLGIPVSLSLLGSEHFAWSLFYDLLGTGMAINILGIAIASGCGNSDRHQHWLTPLRAILQNPALWALAVGFVSRNWPLPTQIEALLTTGAWAVISLSLIAIGMQLSKLNSLHNLKQVLSCLAIKMLLIPLVIGAGLTFVGIAGAPRLSLVLQMAMPPAFGTTLLAEVFNLDRELAVTAIGIGCLSLLFTIPIWMLLFSFS